MKIETDKIRKTALIRLCEEYFSSKVSETIQLTKRTTAVNNWIFKINLENSKSCFGKIYKRDKWERLEREFEAMSYFTKFGQFKTPKALRADKKNYNAIYSFEIGTKKPLKKLTKDDILKFAESAVRLHRIKSSDTGRYFSRTTGRACFKVENHLINYQTKMDNFLDYFNTLSSKDNFAQKVNKRKIIERTRKIAKKIIKNANPHFLRHQIPQTEWRLNNGDFTFDNVIFQKNNGETQLCFVDLEYFGWDDPLRMVGDFLLHDQSSDISDDLKIFFKETYFKERKLGKNSRLRLDLIMKLMNLEWVAIYLRLLIPETLDRNEVMFKGFNRQKYIN